VAGERVEREVTEAWREHRPYLVNLAFRMLGNIADAEDVVQEAFTRLSRAMVGDIQDARGWLIVVTSRLCLDQMRSARSRRETALDPDNLESVTGSGPTPTPDPADRVTLDEGVRLALLVVLQRLNPAERVVFVLHDIFGLPFDAVAETLGRPVTTCRQLARRARKKIEDRHGVGRFDVGTVTHRRVTDKFIAACMNGDLAGLLDVLAPDASGEVDLGPDPRRTPGVVVGAEHVARNMLRYWGNRSTLVGSYPVYGEAVVLGFVGRRLAGILLLDIRDDRIATIHVIADPAKLALMNSPL
jgi:RNA polymerase sigma-70 factor (ECF subfamily)